MYLVYCDDILIHDGSSPDESIHLVDPSLKIGDSVAGDFEFTVPYMNPGYSIIERFSSTIIIYQDSKIIWTGRVVKETEDFWKRRKFSCEGALGYLNDSQQPQYYYPNISSDNFFRQMINNHNGRVNSNRRFTIGAVTVRDGRDSYEYKTEYKSTWETISNVLLKELGGHIRVRYSGSDPTPIIDYYKDYPDTAPQEINFGINLLDFTKNWDLSNLCTVIIPRGKQLEEDNAYGEKDYLTIASVNNGSIYLQNNDAVAQYGIIEQTIDFNDVEDASTLKRLGTEYLSAIQFDDMALSVSAIDLHWLDPSIGSFELLDEVRCVSAPHGLDRMFPITEIDIPLDKPDGVKYTMGTNVSSSLSNGRVSAAKSFEALMNTKLQNSLEDAKRNAAVLINSKTTGYVNIITEGDQSQSLVITNTPDIETATKLWRFNMGGLGYSDDGGETYEIAMTMDGTIVADFIRTGIIDDGMGYNRWNLSTGEFQLAYNSEFVGNNDSSVTIVDVIDATQEAQDTADNAYIRRSGSDNQLNGTNKTLKLVSSGSSWESSTWDASSGDSANVTVVDVSDSPNSMIVKGIKIQLLSGSTLSYVTQRQVPLAESQVYTVSCYAKGSGQIIFSVGTIVSGQNMYSTAASSTLTSSWKRYSFTFKTGNNNYYSDSTNPRLAGLSGGKTNVMYGIQGSSSDTVYICGLKLERGNTASDWSESTEETKTVSVTTSNNYTDASSTAVRNFSKSYTDAISQSDREYTAAQRTALDESFNQYKVLQRLTNNFRNKGIYLQNNELYMNASYVKTGTLDAGIVKTGILTDNAGKNVWNMATGYLKTRNMEAENINASGQFTAGSDVKMVLANGSLDGYNGRTWIGSLEVVSGSTNINSGQWWDGMCIRAKKIVEIRSPEFAILDNNGNGTSRCGYTGYVTSNVVTGISDNGNGTISWTTSQHGIDVLNGIVINLW